LVKDAKVSIAKQSKFLFLFNDILVLAGEGFLKKKYNVEFWISLNLVWLQHKVGSLRGITDGDPVLEIIVPTTSFNVTFESQQEYTTWSLELKSTIDAHLQDQKIGKFSFHSILISR
jgi:hypothetical protein